jgi:hypothetical protein
MLLNPNLEIFAASRAGSRPRSLRTTASSARSTRRSQRQRATTEVPASIGERLLCQQQAQAWQSGLALVNFAKATVVGDLLADALPKVAWMSKRGPRVSSPRSPSLNPPIPRSSPLALANVALDVAIAAISSVPIVGQILGAVVQAALFLYRIFTTPKEAEPELLLPWSRTRTPSTRISSTTSSSVSSPGRRLDLRSGSPRTSSPTGSCTRPRATARSTRAARSGRRSSAAPSLRRGPARLHPEHDPGRRPPAAHPRRAPAAKLRRQWYDFGDIGWGGIVTNVGDFFPSTGQVAGGMWKQAERAGSPDMYKVDARAIKAAWADYFGQFFDSGFSLYKSDASVGELLAPYICTQTTDLRLGIPNLMRPHPAPFVTPAIFKRARRAGRPGTTASSSRRTCPASCPPGRTTAGTARTPGSPRSTRTSTTARRTTSTRRGSSPRMGTSGRP